LPERFAAHVDGAATSDQQQPQRLPPLTGSRHRHRDAGECRPRCAGRVERVIFAAQPALGSRRAAHLEHRLAALGEVAGKTGAVAAGALDRPGAPAGRVALGETKRLPVATRVRPYRLAGHHSSRRCRQRRQDMFVAVGVDADHVVQLVCKHPPRSSDLCS
jgi:hypothetical protein